MVRIVQLLCPERHCVLAVAYESQKPMAEDPCRHVEQRFQEAVEARMLNPWCDICRSRDLHTEDGPTRFATLERTSPDFGRSVLHSKTSRTLMPNRGRPYAQ